MGIFDLLKVETLLLKTMFFVTTLNFFFPNEGKFDMTIGFGHVK